MSIAGSLFSTVSSSVPVDVALSGLHGWLSVGSGPLTGPFSVSLSSLGGSTLGLGLDTMGLQVE